MKVLVEVSQSQVVINVILKNSAQPHPLLVISSDFWAEIGKLHVDPLGQILTLSKYRYYLRQLLVAGETRGFKCGPDVIISISSSSFYAGWYTIG